MQQSQTIKPPNNIEHKRVVLTYEKAVEKVINYIEKNIKYGDVANFCEEHNISYGSLSIIRGGYHSARQTGDFSEIPYNVKVISTILDVMGIPHSIEKPKPKSVFIITDHQTKKNIMEDIEKKEEEYKKLIAQLQRLNLVDFSKAYNYKIDEKSSLEYRGGIAVNEVTVVRHVDRKDDSLIITKYASGIYGYINPNDKQDTGSIINFTKSRIYTWADEKDTIQYILEWVDDNDIILEPVSVAAHDDLTLEDISKGKEKEMVEAQKALMKDFFELRPLEDKKLLKDRNITDSTLLHACFKDIIYNKIVKDAQGHKLFNNVAFPIYYFDEQGLYVTGIEELTADFYNPIAPYYERKDGSNVKTSFTELGFWMSKPSMQAFSIPHFNTHAYIGQTAIDCLSFAQLKAAELKDNFFFISTVGPFEGNPEKRRRLQELLESFGVQKVTLINKNTLEGQISNFLLSAQLYEPAPLVTDENGNTYRAKTEEQSYSPDVSLSTSATGKALVSIKIYFRDSTDKLKKMTFIHNTIREIFGEKTLVAGKFGWRSADFISITGIFQVEIDSKTLENLQMMVEKIQPEKKKFLKIIRPQGLDFSKDLEEKKKLKQEEKLEVKNNIGLGLNIKK